LSREFTETLLILIGIAAGVGLVVAGLVYAGSARRARRYRPGRPFSFTPVWFLAAPERQLKAGAAAAGATSGPVAAIGPAGATGGRELTSDSGMHRPRHGETGGASDRW